MTCAERVRRHRQRQRDGRVVLCIEAEEVALIDKLIARGCSIQQWPTIRNKSSPLSRG
jgi:hypothetical protein